LLFNRFYQLSYKREKKILELAKNKKYVFIDSSSYGKLAKLIKNANKECKIVTFFHNIESQYALQQYYSWLSLLGRPLRFRVLFKNEQWACKYSDKIIVLNKRDNDMLYSLYGRQADAIIPISFSDKYIASPNMKTSDMPTGLFLGTSFFANAHGVLWFAKNVLPFANMRMQVIGRDTDKLDFPSSDKLEVLGYVEDLTPYMQNADFMIFPIFKGSGMKVKTCEALMHGKSIIGTHEAFEGYDVDFGQVGACCETAEEFITAINEFPQKFANKFNEYSRSVFLEKYSDEVIFRHFAKVFEGI
jgi:hypothetical protein